MAETKYVSTFTLPSEYEQAAMEARRRRRMAEMLAAQAYQPQEGGVAPIPTAAPLVQGLQAFLAARQLRKSEEAESKAKKLESEAAKRIAGRMEGGYQYDPNKPVSLDVPEQTQLQEVTPTSRYVRSPEQALSIAETSVGTAALKDRPLMAARLAKLLEKPEAEEFGTTPVLSESGEYVVFGKGGTARPTGVKAKREEAGLTPYQQRMLDLRERELGIRERATAPGTRPLSPTSQKELFETDENVLATQTGIGLLKNALELSPKSFEGVAANERAYAATMLPDQVEPQGAKETLEFDLLIKQQVLPQLRSIFGAAPTEGERAILLELQGSSNLPRKTRENLLNRAIESANRRLEFNRRKAEQIRSGTYFTEGPMQQSTLPPGFELE